MDQLDDIPRDIKPQMYLGKFSVSIAKMGDSRGVQRNKFGEANMEDRKGPITPTQDCLPLRREEHLKSQWVS